MADDNFIHQIYLATQQKISRLVSRIVPPDEIEDIVQEAYVRICQVEDSEEIEFPQSFMFKTAKNLALDYQKSARVRLTKHKDTLEELADMLTDQSEHDEIFNHVSSHDEFSHFCEAVRLLPQQCRRVFVLKKVYGYSQKEIAEQLNLSQSTIEKHISQGMKRCMLHMNKIKPMYGSKENQVTNVRTVNQTRGGNSE